MVLLMPCFVCISCEISIFTADNVRVSAGKMTACYRLTLIIWRGGHKVPGLSLTPLRAKLNADTVRVFFTIFAYSLLDAYALHLKYWPCQSLTLSLFGNFDLIY